MHLLPLLFLLLPRLGIDFPLQKFLLAHQLPPVFQPRRIERSRIQRRLHRASRLPVMMAIAESALPRQRINVRKNLCNAVFRAPQLHLAQTGRVHQQRAARQNEQLPACRGVPSPAIALANRMHFMDRMPQETVRDR